MLKIKQEQLLERYINALDISSNYLIEEDKIGFMSLE